MRFWSLLFSASLSVAALAAAAPALQGEPLSAVEAREVLLLVFLAFGSTVALMRLALRRGGHGLVGVSACIGILAGGLVLYETRTEIRHGWHSLRGEVVPSLALSRSTGKVELRRAWDGHYRADALVNGVPLRMMVDTGASMVLLPHSMAERVGLDPRSLRYTMPVSTANGQSSVAPVRLSTLQVGSIDVRNVTAAVAQPGRLDSPLLGMSFLERLAETSFRGDRLILRQTDGGADSLFISAPGPS